MYKVQKRPFAFFFVGVVLAIVAVQVRGVMASNDRTAAQAAQEAQSFYRAISVGMSQSRIERLAKASNLWTYDFDNSVVYRSRTWFQSIGCENSVNVRVDYDARDRAAKIAAPRTYVTACM